MADPRDTPAMRQYYRFKRQYPECILLFRIGDFYEMFDDDAVTVSKAIGLTLTQRTEGVPMAGLPFHQLDTYLRRLIDKGFRVAVCEQTQTPEQAKAAGGAVIDRAVSRVLTPGTLVDDALLAPDAASTLAAACFLDEGDGPEGRVGVAIADLSTGRFTVLLTRAGSLGDELARRSVSEVLYAQAADGTAPPRIKRVLESLSVPGSPQPSWHFRQDEAVDALLKQYKVATLDGFGLDARSPLVRAAGAIVRYLVSTQAIEAEDGSAPTAPTSRRGFAASLGHLQPPRIEETTGQCVLDATSLRSLEILRTIRASRGLGVGVGGAEIDGSLLGIFAPSKNFPGCRTAMGKRQLRDWLCRPLSDLGAIRARLRGVATLAEDRRTAESLASVLSEIQDVSRIAARLALARASPRDLVGLGGSLGRARLLLEVVSNAPAFAPTARRLESGIASLEPLAAEIGRTCIDSPPNHLREGGLIRDGVDAELDEARLLRSDAAAWMAEYQKRLVQQHDLPSLKVGFNKIFGYFIELPSAQSRRAPEVFTRKQTLKSAERYTTPELKDFEHKVSTAEARSLAREHAIFDGLCVKAAMVLPAIAEFADAAAELDCLACFAEKAFKRRWTEPVMVEEPVLLVEQGRHPVLDELLESQFVPNDIELGGRVGGLHGVDASDVGVSSESPGGAEASLALITGPNMAGKSTFIRMAALITLLAHCGSFVPADRATIGLTDRIFTRIGADDALHAGQSTFMVEMTETARILNHASERSLIILDEIGRGTSTLDGLSLAWAIAERLSIGGSGGVTNIGNAGAKSKRRSKERASETAGVGEGGAGRSPRVLFATHYHELTDLEDLHPGRVRNLHVSVREWGVPPDVEIIFLHRILPGRTDQSYGLHVAKLAGLPPAVVDRAREVLEKLAVHHVRDGRPTAAAGPVASNGRAPGPAIGSVGDPQLSLFTEYLPHPAVAQLREIKLDALTPLQAFDALRRLHGIAADGAGQPG